MARFASAAALSRSCARRFGPMAQRYEQQPIARNLSAIGAAIGAGEGEDLS
jgi:hypothetical protein